MSEEINQMNNVVTSGWHHWVPFAALMVRDSAPPNRPMTTRLIEQTFVAVVAGGGSAYGVITTQQARQEEQIKSITHSQADQVSTLKEMLRDSEMRLTAQIVELRTRQLK